MTVGNQPVWAKDLLIERTAGYDPLMRDNERFVQPAGESPMRTVFERTLRPAHFQCVQPRTEGSI